jgi:hypothetical protein
MSETNEAIEPKCPLCGSAGDCTSTDPQILADCGGAWYRTALSRPAEAQPEIVLCDERRPDGSLVVTALVNGEERAEMSFPAQPVARAPEGLRETVERTIEVIERQLDLIAERAPGDFLDKRPVVQSLGAHKRRLEQALEDAPQAPADWFWLVGYLAGKALHAHAAGNVEKAEHHIITTAAALDNWHLHLFGRTSMRPGVDSEKTAGFDAAARDAQAGKEGV